MATVEPVRWVGDALTGHLTLLEQRLLPAQEEWLRVDTAAATAGAIIDLLGVVFTGHPDPTRLLALAEQIRLDDIAANRRMGELGAALLPGRVRMLTYCNTGSLATAGFGTALGVIRTLHAQGRLAQAYACETRPYLQGARLTMWEMMREEIPCTLLTDNMVGALMRAGEIDGVVVGADRVARNGDTANKIGTYSVAVLAREHNVPFYVAAPLSTIDLNTANGDGIPIEERNSREVTHVGSNQLTPEGAHVWNPAFDVTPSHLIAGIITETGIFRAPYVETLRQAFSGGGD